MDGLKWRHNERDGVPYHRRLDCLLNHLSSTDQRKHQSSDLCVGNSAVTREFPAQRASNAENDSIWWRHHVDRCCERLSFLLNDFSQTWQVFIFPYVCLAWEIICNKLCQSRWKMSLSLVGWLVIKVTHKLEQLFTVQWKTAAPIMGTVANIKNVCRSALWAVFTDLDESIIFQGCQLHHIGRAYNQTSNIRRTKSQQLNVPRFVF